jgi:hypothetical protein
MLATIRYADLKLMQNLTEAVVIPVADDWAGIRTTINFKCKNQRNQQSSCWTWRAMCMCRWQWKAGALLPQLRVSYGRQAANGPTWREIHDVAPQTR